MRRRKTVPHSVRFRQLRCEPLEPRTLLAAGALPFGAAWTDTSEYMIGSVWVSVVLLESNGGHDKQSENWTKAERTGVLKEIREGAKWWEAMFYKYTKVGATVRQELKFHIDRTYLDHPIATGYEPIRRPSTDDTLWIGDFLEKVNKTTVRAWNNDQRRAHGTDWAYTVFVVDSSWDADGCFSNGKFAYAYKGGPYVVMTYDNQGVSALSVGFGWLYGRGIRGMGQVFAHETSHIFWACDEYKSPKGTLPDSLRYNFSYFARSGYYNAQNLNAWDDNPNASVLRCITRVPSIMAGDVVWPWNLQTRAYLKHTASWSSLQMIGWRDSDRDGLSDVVDCPLTLTGRGSYNRLTGNYEFSGQSSVRTYPNTNSQPASSRHNITINTVNRILYRLDGGDWVAGNEYGSATAAVAQCVPVGVGMHTIEFRTQCDSPNVVSPAWSATFEVVRNDPPSFTPGPDQIVNENVGLQTVANWAANISAGPPDEWTQVLAFLVTNDNHALFSVQPTIAADGTLTYQPAENARGMALVTVVLKDNGGTENGGQDTSAMQTFGITVTSAVAGIIHGTSGADIIRIARREAGSQQVDVYVNSPSMPSYTLDLATIPRFQIFGESGDDRMEVDFINGSPLPSGGLLYDGSTQADNDILTINHLDGAVGMTVTSTQVLLTGLPTIDYCYATVLRDGENSYKGGMTARSGTLRIDRAGALPIGTNLTITDGNVVPANGLNRAIGLSGLSIPNG